MYYPPPNFVTALSVTNSTGGTIYTVPSDRDFYLYGVTLSVSKDVTSTSTSTHVSIVINGSANNVISIAGTTLTPLQDSVTLSLSKPIKIDKGTNISLFNTTNVANIISKATIIGYLED